MKSKARRFRELLYAPEILVAPGVFDGFSARIVEAAGFKAGTITGAGISESRLGWADRGIMGLEENLHACRAIAACTDLPLRADADTGYGNAINVHFTVRSFEAAGLASIMIAVMFLYIISAIFILGGELNASIMRYREARRALAG
jgi:2-methylisocitrate lyase-like PEP mutase family enzyme